jgi:hopanoid biosynthesis associated protein HpnK
MVGAPATADAVARAKCLPGLRVGLHLVLIEGQPMLPPEQVPDLVDGRGMFRDDMVRAGIAFFFRPAVRRQLSAEIEAQFAAFQATGLPLDHVNAHKHLHLHPTVAALTLRIGRRYGLCAMRVPLEPRDVLEAVQHGRPSSVAIVSIPWALLLRAQARRRGLTVPDQVFGLAWSGCMTTARLAGLLDRLPSGITEIYMHPATRSDFAGAAARYSYVEELAALVDPTVAAALRGSGARLGGFADHAPQ